MKLNIVLENVHPAVLTMHKAITKALFICLTKKLELQLMHCVYAVSSCSKSHLKDILLYDYLPLKNFDVNIKVHLH